MISQPSMLHEIDEGVDHRGLEPRQKGIGIVIDVARLAFADADSGGSGARMVTIMLTTMIAASIAKIAGQPMKSERAIAPAPAINEADAIAGLCYGGARALLLLTQDIDTIGVDDDVLTGREEGDGHGRSGDGQRRHRRIGHAHDERWRRQETPGSERASCGGDPGGAPESAAAPDR